MNTLEWFSHLENINGRQEVAKMFSSGAWKIDFYENSPTFVCYSERECKTCPNCSKERCLCSIESTQKISHSLYQEQMLIYCSEFMEFC
ncbi:MAG: hypothetical protein PHU29_09885 [Sulfuricurvum sp.]|uniref:hypothetical protein n=1 Tax=Sulfuricurvum sp. TaxID=2025608 RepID=UPI00262E8A4A|nr:hypothetical protein [Sulfuricurvum sp.]MDD2951086.1 hypothetical protein [Sulfuricurvum sp.]MDD5118672.1 hypothetical protein [Sulfuricurvum sp.]